MASISLNGVTSAKFYVRWLSVSPPYLSLPAMRSLLTLATLLIAVPTFAQQPPTREEAVGAVRRAVTFFRDKISADGGDVWRYSEDLSLREGEEKTAATQAWIQPPGTPSVGEAFLAAYERTKEQFFLDAAIHTAWALVKGQLHSGCWSEYMEIDPEQRKNHAYRVDG